MRAFASSMWAVASSMSDFTTFTHGVQATFVLLHPTCVTHMRSVVYCILLWDVAASTWADAGAVRAIISSMHAA